MFTGIVETQVKVLEAVKSASGVLVKLEKPSNFDDLSVGDSVCVNGVCLTVEQFNDEWMEFTLAAETLQITGWSASNLVGPGFNVERSLRFGDRVHGHLVTGHVDALTEVLAREQQDGSEIFWLKVPTGFERWIWRKGCVALNGVSLTVNEVSEERFSVCLIPETLRRTNWSNLQLGDALNIEVDYLAKALVAGDESRLRSEKVEVNQ